MSSQPLGQMIIELGLDSADFTNGMKGINQQIKSSMTEMKAHLNVIGRSGNEIDKLKVKQTGLTDAITAQNKKLALAKENHEACRAAVEGSEKATQKQKDALIKSRNEYVRAIGELGSYEDQLQEVQIRLTTLESELYKAGTAVTDFGGRMTKIGDITANIGKSLTAGLTMPIIGLGTYAVKTTAEFDAAMSRVSAVSGAVGEDFNKLRDKAREMGEKTKFSAKEAADAMNYMAMAGWKTNDMLGGIEGIMNLAAASGESLAATSDIVTDALTGFGHSAAEAGHLADIMAAASSNANTNVSMMGETFKYCTPIAGALGFSMEDTAQAIGLMANSGVKASMAGTAMRTMMNNLAGEIKFTSGELGEVSIRTQEYEGSMRGLNDILSDCREAFSHMTEAEQVANAEALVGQNAMSGFLAVMNAAPADIEKLNQAIANSEGVALEMAETMGDNLPGQLTILKSQTDELAISFGDILMPKIMDMVSGVQRVADKLNKMDDGTKNMIVSVGLFAATAGPAVLVVGKLTSGIGSAATNAGKAMTKFAQWAAKLTVNTAAAGAHASATAADTAATQASTAVTAKNSAGLMMKTAKVLADTAASKLHTAAEMVKSLALKASTGALTQQAAALNTSILTKGKDTAATVAHTLAEKLRSVQTGISTGQISLNTVTTIASTTATNACAVATGFLAAAFKLLWGPVGVIIAGLTLLVAGVAAVVKWFNRESEASKVLRKETGELATANDALVDSLGDSQKTYKENEQSIKAEAGAAKALAGKIAELSKVENKSAAQKKELQTYVEMLNDSAADLNLQYDLQSDALSHSTEEIYNQISALEQQAEAQAAQERMIEILKEQLVINEQLVQVQDKITEATENTSLTEKERKNIIADLTEQENTLKEEIETLGDSYAYVSDVIAASSAAESEAVTGSTQTILEAYGSLGAAYDDLGKKQKAAIDDIQTTFETMTGKLSGLQEKIKLDDETTWQKIKENQADTIAKTQEFSELYAQLIEAGVSDSYLNAIGATGPESIPLLKQMLAQGTDAVLTSQNEWQEAYSVISDTLVDSLKLDDTTSGALKDYILGEAGIYGTLQGAISEADLDALGKSLTEGVSKGVLENTDNVKTASANMMKVAEEGAKEQSKINSPSKVFEEIGKFLMQGLVQGMERYKSLAYAKASEIANNVTKTIKGVLDINSPSGVMRDEVGKNIALGIAEGIINNKNYAEKSAEDIASAVLQAAKTKLDNTKVYQELSLADEAAYWDGVRKQVKEGTQARIDADKQYFQTKKSFDQKMLDHEKNYTAKSKKLYEDLNKNIQTLQDSYTDKLASRTKSIADSMNLFSEFKAKTELTTADLLQNLQSQVTGLNDWSRNLKQLERCGIGDGLLEELRGMGTGAAGEIALLTKMTDKELKQYVALWKQKQRLARKEATRELEPLLEETEMQISKMRAAASKELDGYKMEFVTAMTEIGVEIQKPLNQIQTSLLNTMSSVVQMAAGTISSEADKQANVTRFEELAASVFRPSETLPAIFVQLGKDTVSGLIQGLQERAGDLSKAMTDIIGAAIKAAKDEAQIHSPSRVMASIGSYMMEGLGVGMENMQSYVEGQAGKITGKITDVFRTGLNSEISMPDLTLTDKTGVIAALRNAMGALREKQEYEQNKGNHNHKADATETLLERLVDANNRTVKLLQKISEKDIVIDKTAMTDVVGSGMGRTNNLKTRFV